MKITFLILVLTSCAATRPEMPCVTACGVDYIGGSSSPVLPSGWSCEAVKAAEVKALLLYEKHKVSEKDMRFLVACRALRGFSLSVQSTKSWTDAWGRYIDGMTVCTVGSIQVGSALPGKGALMHEYAHAIQGCHSYLPIDESRDRDHSDWSRTGIDAALQEWEDG